MVVDHTVPLSAAPLAGVKPGCGRIFAGLTLKDRWVDCACGLSLDRDHNAAINILNRGGQLRWSSSSPIGGLGQEAARL